MNLLSLSLLEAIVRTGSYSGAAKEKNFGYFPKVVGRSMSNDILLSKETLFFW